MEASLVLAEVQFIISNWLSTPLYLFVDWYSHLCQYKVLSKMLPSRNRSSLCACTHTHKHTFLITSTHAIPPTPQTPPNIKRMLTFITDGAKHVTCQKSKNALGQRGCWKWSGLLKEFWKIWLWQQDAQNQHPSPAAGLTFLLHQPSHLTLQWDECLLKCLTF